MPLELGSFPVTDAAFGSETRWRDGVLEIDHDELLGLVQQDALLRDSRLELTRPGESARIVNYHDVLEPRVKVSGPGTVYPGVWGRSGDKVGTGRTHRLAGFAVVECLDTSHLPLAERVWPSLRLAEHPAEWEHFIDMSGPGALRPPFGGLNNLCMVIRASEEAGGEDRRSSMHAAALRLADRLAETTAGLEPPDLETIDLTPQPGLPNVAFVSHLASSEWEFGARSPLGTAVYGMTRLTFPWILDPTEMLDGAVYTGGSGNTTWMMVNNPVVLEACRRHGRQVNFKACAVQWTNWTSEEEKKLMASRLAHLLTMAGIQAVVITNDARGQRFVEAILSVQACERAGLKVVFLTEEEDNETGTAPPLLMSVPELKAAVSSGTGAVPSPFPAVERVIGCFGEAVKSWYEELPPVHGRYGTRHFSDIYGHGTQSAASF